MAQQISTLVVLQDSQLAMGSGGPQHQLLRRSYSAPRFWGAVRRPVSPLPALQQLTLFFRSGCGPSATITLPIAHPSQAIQLRIPLAWTNKGPTSASLSFKLRIE